MSDCFHRVLYRFCNSVYSSIQSLVLFFQIHDHFLKFHDFFLLKHCHFSEISNDIFLHIWIIRCPFRKFILNFRKKCSALPI